jgi:phospholipase/carboxylesterase
MNEASGDQASGPHQGQPVVTAGVSLDDATVAMVMVHGRGATARGIIGLSQEFGTDREIAYVAPQAADNSWYPNSFLAPFERNEPELSSALRAVGEAVERVRNAGLPSERTLLLGFSQGACLTLEYVARNPRRYGGVVGLSGGLIGPDSMPREYTGALQETSVFLGCSDVDPHIPLERVHETADVFRQLHGDVTERIYDGMAHTINDDEIAFTTELIREVSINE